MLTVDVDFDQKKYEKGCQHKNSQSFQPTTMSEFSLLATYGKQSVPVMKVIKKGDVHTGKSSNNHYVDHYIHNKVDLINN